LAGARRSVVTSSLAREPPLTRLYYQLHIAPPWQTIAARRQALEEIFGRPDVDLIDLSRARLRRILWHVLRSDPTFSPATLSVAIALGYVGFSNFATKEPDLCRELDLRWIGETGGYLSPADLTAIERRNLRRHESNHD
jgi:hypothetical protein